ncbi:hypothetical protein [Cryobacterium sp. GrIS_2_6]|uniref:hypothetical protein n=1 Tax=Cryobacterium sp. GrIS_2_6 TaxID=3162785 RepID=UPI002DFE9176|nr:hypothetical protein [Cryobacterium psychrotolerans]
MIEIARNTTTNHRNGTIDLCAKVDGKKVVFVYSDRRIASSAYNKLLKQGAEYLLIAEEDKTYLWAGVERI